MAAFCLGLSALALTAGPASAEAAVLSEPQKRVLEVADRILEEAQVSYVYGGFQIGDSGACERCNSCLEKLKPAPRQRLARCPACRACSLDCSHFTELVYREAGMPYPYLATSLMLSLDSRSLLERYRLVDLGTDLPRSQPGDLLVYDGHVVLLEKRRQPAAGRQAWRGDIVHATGGGAVRSPGEGVQRERFVELVGFRGPLRRILRPTGLLATPSAGAR